LRGLFLAASKLGPLEEVAEPEAGSENVVAPPLSAGTRKTENVALPILSTGERRRGNTVVPIMRAITRKTENAISLARSAGTRTTESILRSIGVNIGLDRRN
jgi:hypothetical protein